MTQKSACGLVTATIITFYLHDNGKAGCAKCKVGITVGFDEFLGSDLT